MSIENKNICRYLRPKIDILQTISTLSFRHSPTEHNSHFKYSCRFIINFCMYVCAVPGRPKKRTSLRATEPKKLKKKVETL